MGITRVKDKKNVTITNFVFGISVGVIKYSLPLAPRVFDEPHKI